MYRRSARAVFLLCLWFYTGNHCILADAFTSPQSKHSHCGGSESNEKNQSHHSKCSGHGCCHPVITAGDSLSFSATEISLTQIPLHLIPSHVGWFLPPDGMGLAILHCLSPPETRQRSLVSSLKQAPNAPPVIS